ncbi:hydrolase [Streptomyces sp. NPDC046985]|uniref:hydrolase n=1 Tax=Streptomyces sp. NPDC046985 TaxID=3155377 RepID=UPI0033ECBE51
MTLWTSLEPASTTVDAGSSTTVRLRVRNTGDVVDEYRFEPVGPLAPWTTVEPATLRLYPGTTGAVELRFAPPRSPDATAGPNPYAVRITPTEHPEAVTVPEGNLTITPFTEVRAELVPPTVKGRFRGRPQLAVDNVGNTRLTASIAGSDNGDQLSYEVRPGSVQIEPGRAAFVKATLRPRRIIWFGAKQQRPFTLSVLRSGVEPLPVQGTYVQRGFLPRWLATFFGVLTGLAVTFAMLWIAYKPGVDSGATEKVAVGATLAPSTSPTVTPPPPPTAVAPTPPAPPPTQKSDDGGGGKGGGGGPAPTVTKKAPEDTAASAVRRLADADPAGRHICYRAFVSGKGWQKPVCDGTTAGTVGLGLPIKAINIAVAGAGGTAANAFLHKDGSTGGQGQWSPRWTAVVADGRDDYIGSPKPEDPYMSGFAVDVGTGDVCEDNLVHGRQWGGKKCAKQRPEFIFGGALENDVWLEAFRLKV